MACAIAHAFAYPVLAFSHTALYAAYIGVCPMSVFAGKRIMFIYVTL